MTPIKLTGEYFGVSIPLGTFHFGIHKNQRGEDRLIFHKGSNFDSLPIPPGNWLFIGTSENLTEEHAAEIVELAVHIEDYEKLVNDGWWNYQGGAPFKTAIESFRSLLSSLGIKDRIAILKQIK